MEKLQVTHIKRARNGYPGTRVQYSRVPGIAQYPREICEIMNYTIILSAL